MNRGTVTGVALVVVTQDKRSLRAVIAQSAHCHAADRSLELNQGVGPVVVVSWESLTTSTEVAVITDSTLVANTTDVALSRFILA
jgi:hypothetical protein